MAMAGVVVKRSGACAASPQPRMRASGVSPRRATAAAEASTSAAAPSDTPEALPAVTVPPVRWNEGDSLRNVQQHVSVRRAALPRASRTHFASEAASPPLDTDSSAVTTVGGAPLRLLGTSTATTSSAKHPAAAAAAARA